MCVRYSESTQNQQQHQQEPDERNAKREEEKKNQNWMNELLDVELFSHDQR